MKVLTTKTQLRRLQKMNDELRQLLNQVDANSADGEQALINAEAKAEDLTQAITKILDNEAKRLKS